jgi:hypothetical protein
MLGGWEFSIFGNVLMGLMAIGGVCSMVYAVGTSMTSSSSAGWGPLEDEACNDGKEAA